MSVPIPDLVFETKPAKQGGWEIIANHADDGRFFIRWYVMADYPERRILYDQQEDRMSETALEMVHRQRRERQDRATAQRYPDAETILRGMVAVFPGTGEDDHGLGNCLYCGGKVLSERLGKIDHRAGCLWVRAQRFTQTEN